MSAPRGGSAVPRAAWLLIGLLLAGCAGLTNERPVDPYARDPTLDLVRQVLAERLAAEDLPDFGLIRTGTQITVSPVVAIAGGDLVLTAEEAARIPGWTIRLLDRDAARAEADATNDDVFYLEIAVDALTTNTATVWFGVQMVMPSISSARPMCCCERSARYAKHGAAWHLEEWNPGLCI